MNDEMYGLHISAGIAAGKESACGSKIDYKSEATATKAASKMTVKYNKAKEAYPCAYCNGWHIGRFMTKEELMLYLEA